jgi:hypothetical protein
MWLSGGDLKAISQRARHGARYLSSGENQQLIRRDIPRLVTEAHRYKGTLRILEGKAGALREAAYNMAWPLASRWDEAVVSRCWWCDEPVTTPYTKMKHLRDCRQAAVVSAVKALDRILHPGEALDV